VPVLSTIHDLMHRYEKRFPEVSANGEYESREESYRNICKYTKGILVDSEVGKRHVQESYGLPEDHIFILPYIPPKYIYKYETSSDFDIRYKLPPKFIFYPAHFWHHKNHVGLLYAIAQLKEEIPDLQLVLVGSKHNSYKRVRQYVTELGLETNIHFVGHVPNQDIPGFYRRARALVMPTYFGPTNIPPLEAFVLGCPTATSAVYGIPDQVGDATLLFNPESVNEIANCIKRLWTDDELCQNLVEKGKRRAASWGEDQFNNRLLEIVEQMTTS
jgi:glycosyltransferase involved in cell wall biosynthesis